MQQIRSLHFKLKYLTNGIDTREYSEKVYQRKEKLELYRKLRDEGCSEKTALEVLKVPRSTFFRWQKNYRLYGLAGLENQSKCPATTREPTWNSNLESKVLSIRRKHPVWGKYKIAVVLKREFNIDASPSTIGRIIKSLVAKGKVKPAHFYYGRIKKKRARIFNKHANRLPSGAKATKPGQLIQVDHAVIELDPNYSIRQFEAICPVSKIVVSGAYCRATSRSASLFLEKMQQEFPFKIESIQVDGGSEFMGFFEEACQKKRIDLWVLPPKSPEINGNVERSHGTIKYEFYSIYSGQLQLDEIRVELRKFVESYNTYRPHQSLGYLTPMDFYLKLEA